MPGVGQNILITSAAISAAEVLVLPQLVTIGSTIGTFFAPSVAAGGAAKIVAASLSGSLLTFIPASFGILIAGSLLLTGLNCKNQALINLGIFVGILDIVGTHILAAKIGAAITGTATGAVLICNAIGVAIILLSMALVLGTLLAGGAAIASSCSENTTARLLRG